MVKQLYDLTTEVFVKELPVLVDHELLDRMLILMHDNFIDNLLINIHIFPILTLIFEELVILFGVFLLRLCLLLRYFSIISHSLLWIIKYALLTCDFELLFPRQIVTSLSEITSNPLKVFRHTEEELNCYLEDQEADECQVQALSMKSDRE